MPVPSFDTWTIVFLIAAVQGYFVALVLFRWRRGQAQANYLLAALICLFALTLTEYVLYWTNYIYRIPVMANISAQFPFLFGPLVYLYLRVTFGHGPLNRYDWWHFLPFALAFSCFLPWYLLDGASKQQVVTGQAPFPLPAFWYRTLLWFRIAHLSVYALWISGFIRRQPAVAGTTRWANLLNGFYIGFVLSYTSYFVLVRFPFFNSAWDYHISAAMTAFIYLIAYSGYAQPAVFDGFDWTEPAAPVKYRNSGLTPEASRTLLQKLVRLMDAERLYRNPDLSLDLLASRLDASKHHVSQIINAELGGSFFEYINQLRIEEAKQLLAETSRSDLHVIEAAYAVGFNNKVSFNTAFKKATGMTPTEYRSSHSRSDMAGSQPGAVGDGQ